MLRPVPHFIFLCVIFSVTVMDGNAQQPSQHYADSLLRSLKISQKRKDIKGTIALHNRLGDHYAQNPELEELAKLHYRSSMQIALQARDSLEYGRIANSMGHLFFNRANFDSTIFYYLEAQKAFKNNSSYEYAHTFSSIGSLYFTFNAYKSALNYFRQSLYWKQQNPKDSWSTPFAYWCIAEAHYAMENSDSALYYYQLSSSVADTTRDIPFYGNEGIAQILIDNQLFDSALVILEPVEPWYLEAGVSGWISDLGLLYMRIFLEKKQNADFKRWSAVVKQEAFREYLPEQRRRYYELMSQFHKRENNLDSAFYYQQKTTEQWEAISKAQGNSNIDKVIAAFNALKFESNLRQKELEKKSQEIENRRLSETNQLFSWVLILLAVLLVMLVSILFLLNKQRRRIKDKNATILAANEEISQQFIQLDNKEKRIRQMQMKSENLFAIFDDNFNLIQVNDAFIALFPGINEGNDLRADIRNILTDEQQKELETVIKNLEPFDSAVIEWKWKSPEIFGVSFKVMQLLDDPSVQGFVMEGQNITDTLLEQQGEKSQLEDQLKKKDEILSNVHQKIALSHLQLELKQKMLKEIDIRLERTQQKTNNNELNEVKRRLKQEKHVDRHWDGFLHHFDAANNAFFRKLKQQHANLTTNDEKHCAFLLLRLSNKEVGIITGVTPDSVKKARQRLKKKLALDKGQSLTDYLDSIVPDENTTHPSV